MSDVKQLAQQILSEIDRELAVAEGDLQDATRKVASLREKREAALLLMEGSEDTIAVSTPIKSNGAAKNAGIVYVSRPKTGDLVLEYLREHSYHAAPMQIYNDLKEQGAPVGKNTYIYHVLDRLEKKGLVDKSPDGKYAAKELTQ